ncbi:MAG: type I DNA topoisomerase [Planctomycetes bacterium]|nr:type I DNA topoisomerase [Planctomycetota bacterium]
MISRTPKRVKGLVIVESPAKARKIETYLGKDYRVLASMGHVRDLPSSASEIPPSVRGEPWATLGVNVEKDFEPVYVVPKEKKKVVQELKKALKEAEELILATDEDREGESIGWHLTQLLKPRVPVKRMVFSEITKAAIQHAIQHPRQLDEHLVSAQEARRILDRLFGYTLSPLLWKKIKQGLSAGRVQSVAVRLLVERELERMAFKSATYWDLKARLETPEKRPFEAVLVSVHGKRVATGKDFDETTGRLKPNADVLLLNEEQAQKLREKLASCDWVVASVETRDQVRKPYAPFTTSTLQQEANRKLGMSARQTMQIAQRLYENGYITYMRTDSVHLSDEAIQAARKAVKERYGEEYLSPEPRQFVTRTKGAQEAHEAIRPAGTEMKTGEELGLAGPDLKLYSLIWKRTMATQMAEARLRFQTVIIRADDTEFRATGRHVVFPGFFRAYVEGVDDPEAALDDQEAALPPLEENQKVVLDELEALPHETKPPARYTEATLVRELEADGIGRPSTYATIIGTIQDRGYVRKVGNQLIPTFTAIAVTRLLEQFFPKLVDYQFTAQMEEVLDEMAAGQAERLPYLRKFYLGKEGLAEQVKVSEERIDPRWACTLELAGVDAKIRVGRYGPYLEKEVNGETLTASLPDDLAPADLTNELAEELLRKKKDGPKSLGMHPEEDLPVYVLEGPFGPYVQLGEVTEENPKPKRVSIPPNLDPNTLTLEQAVALLGLPRTLGPHPETGKVVKAGIGRYGPYVSHDGKYKSLGKQHDVLTIDLETAVELLKQPRGTRTPVRELGPHPEDGQPVAIYDGRYGPYVKHGKINATIPKDRDIDQVTLEDAVAWLAEKAAKKSRSPSRRKSATRRSKKADQG